MKYLRKMFMLLIGIAFFVALIISVGRIFAVKNININLITYEEDSTESYNTAKKALSVHKGESMLFLSESDITGTLVGNNYVVISCEKKFPCTINVTIKERMEIFAVSVGGRYSMYDDNGEYLRRADENLNEDGTPNVLVTGIAAEQMGTVANIAEIFKSKFGGLRSIVESVNVDSRPEIEGFKDRLILNLRCGLIIQLDDYAHDCEEKIDAAYKRFCTLSDKEKLSGRIRVVLREGEEIYADYN